MGRTTKILPLASFGLSGEFVIAIALMGIDFPKVQVGSGGIVKQKSECDHQGYDESSFFEFHNFLAITINNTPVNRTAIAR